MSSSAVVPAAVALAFPKLAAIADGALADESIEGLVGSGKSKHYVSPTETPWRVNALAGSSVQDLRNTASASRGVTVIPF